MYDNQIPLKIKSFEREEYQSYLNLKISQIQQSGHQVYHFELTDESNNVFLLNLDLTEHDYINLKNEQSLCIDFHQFPSKLGDMLQLCIGQT